MFEVITSEMVMQSRSTRNNQSIACKHNRLLLTYQVALGLQKTQRAQVGTVERADNDYWHKMKNNMKKIT